MAWDTLILDPDGAAFPLVDGVTSFLNEQAWDPTDPEVLLAKSIDTEGARSAWSHDQNLSLTFTVRVEGDMSLPDQARALDIEQRVAAIQAQVARINRNLTGVLRRTSKAGTVMFYDLVAGARAVPAFDTGLYGLAVAQTVAVTLPALPYARQAPIDITLTQVPGPFDEALPLYVASCADIPGDVPALAELTITNGGTLSKQYVRWGVEQEPVDGTILFFNAEDLLELGGTAYAVTATGTWRGEYESVVAGSDYMAFAGFSQQHHQGSYRVLARLRTLTTGTSTVALEWGTGDAVAVTRNDPVTLGSAFAIVDLGQITSDGVWGASLLVKDGDAGLDWLVLLPVDRSGVAQAATSLPAPSVYVAADDLTGSGALTGSTDDVNNVWGGTGDADDFTRTSSGAIRNTTLDTGGGIPSVGGRVELIGSSQQDIGVAVTADLDSSPALGGVVARYVDVNNALVLVMGRADTTVLTVRKIVAGAQTFLGTVTRGEPPVARLSLEVTGASWRALFDGLEVLSGSDVDLAPGGALAAGRVGFVDANVTSGAGTRTYVNFQAWEPVVDAVVFADRDMKIANDGLTRESSDGTASARVARYQGDYLALGPGDPRLVVLADEADPPLGSADGTDLSATLLVTPRFLLTP